MSLWSKAVPLILANAPALVDGARKMLDKRRSAGNGARGGAEGEGEGPVEHRLTLLENRERKMLELIESLATSNQQMIEAIAALRQRARINMGISIVLFIGLVIALVRAFS